MHSRSRPKYGRGETRLTVAEWVAAILTITVMICFIVVVAPITILALNNEPEEYGPSMGSLYRELDQYGDVGIYGFSYSDDYMATLDVDNRPNVDVDIKCEGDTPEEALSCVLHKFKTIGVK